jgi:hypothetical protein
MMSRKKETISVLAEAVFLPRLWRFFLPVQHPTDEYHRPDAVREEKQ